MAGSGPIGIFSKDHIPYPVDIVFNTPMRTNPFQQLRSARRPAAKIMARLPALFATNLTFSPNLDHALQPLPVVTRAQVV